MPPTLKNVVVVGAGIAGLSAAEALRRRGYDGRLTLVGAEADPPYDRPPLSKEVLTGTRSASSCLLRSPEQLAALDVELLLGRAVSSLELDRRALVVGRERLSFDGLILASGAQARPLPELAGRENVFTLRSLADATALAAAFDRGGPVVVVGGGVIGCEVASSARGRGLETTVVEAAPAPMLRSVGAHGSALCLGRQRRHGVEVLCDARIERFEGNGRVDRLVLADGTVLEPETVVVGIGVTPTVSWLQGSGLAIEDGIVCDASLNAGHPLVFAAGDAVNWPNPLLGRRMRGEQWTGAVEQARRAAKNLLGTGEAAPYSSANYFWTDQCGVRVQFVGSHDADEVVVVDGDPDSDRVLAWHRRGERLVGALSIGAPKLLMMSKGLIESGSSWSAALAQLELSA